MTFNWQQKGWSKATVTMSRATVKRAVATLVAAGKIEHRGSKKTGGYYAKDAK